MRNRGFECALRGWQALRRLKIEFAMRTEAHEFQVIDVRFPMDQNQVWFDVAVRVIGPVTNKRVAEFVRRQRLVGDKPIDNLHKECIKHFAVSP